MEFSGSISHARDETIRWQVGPVGVRIAEIPRGLWREPTWRPPHPRKSRRCKPSDAVVAAVGLVSVSLSSGGSGTRRASHICRRGARVPAWLEIPSTPLRRTASTRRLHEHERPQDEIQAAVLCSYAAMTSTVTTPSRPLAAGSRPRRSGPAVLSLSKGGGGQRRQRRLAPSTSCAVLASPDKQSTANKLPLSSRKQEEEVEKATDYNEVAAALETIYKLSPAVEVEEKKRQGGNEDDGGGEAKKKRKRRVVSCSVSPVLST